jgi:hypothetical protein
VVTTTTFEKMVENALSENLGEIDESDSQPDPSEAVVPLLIVCDIPIIPKLAPLTIASDDPVLGKPVELVEIVGSATVKDVFILWICLPTVKN